MNVYQRETDEFLPVPISHAGVAVTTGVEYSIVLNGARPAAWTPAANLGGQIGVTIAGLASNVYDIYAQITASPEIPVIFCGSFIVN